MPNDIIPRIQSFADLCFNIQAISVIQILYIIIPLTHVTIVENRRELNSDGQNFSRTIFTILGYDLPYEHPCYQREYIYSPNPSKTSSIRTPEIPSFETFASFEHTFTLLSILIQCGTKILIYILFINVFFQIKQIWLRHEKYYYYHYIHYNLQLLKGKSKLFL